MSGSTHVKVESDYFEIGLETPCMNFGKNSQQEREYHDQKNKLFSEQLAIIKPMLEALFEKLKIDANDDLKLRNYSSQLPEIDIDLPESASEKKDFPCSINFYLSQSGLKAGFAYIRIAFDELPDKKACLNLKRLIEKKIVEALRKNEKNW